MNFKNINKYDLPAEFTPRGIAYTTNFHTTIEVKIRLHDSNTASIVSNPSDITLTNIILTWIVSPALNILSQHNVSLDQPACQLSIHRVRPIMFSAVDLLSW